MMSKSHVSLAVTLIALLVALNDSGCGGGTGATSITVLPITVSVIASPTSVQAGATAQITATVSNDSANKGVTWTVTCPATPCGTASPTATSSGAATTYTPPTNPPSGGLTVTVTATSAADTSKSASASITVTVALPPITVSVAPGASTVQAGATAQFTATVTNDSANKGVTWTVTCSAAPCGIVAPTATASGAATTYTAPANAPSAGLTVTITATSVADSAKAASATITIPADTVNDSELSGHYAFLFNGFDDATGSQMALAGSFTVDGKGGITEGTEDFNGPGGPSLNVPFTGTYNIGSDNRGAFTISAASGTKSYALVLSSINGGVAQKARFVEFDDTTGTNGTRGSGGMRLQDTTAFTLASVTGPYAFGFVGQDGAGKRNAIVGSFLADGAGNIPSGSAEQNVAGTATNPSLTGTYNAPSSSNGRSSMTLTPSGASSLDLTAYVVSANELLLLTTNAFSSDGVLSGAMLSQTSTTFSDSSLNAPAVYYQIGVDPSAATTESFAEIGLLITDGKGNLTATYDTSLGGVLTQNQTFTATYSVPAGGRVTISGWYGNSASPLRVLYLVDNNNAFFLDTDAGVGFGFVEPQALGPFSNASLSGTLPAATTAPSVSSDPNVCGLATLDASGRFTEIASASDVSGLFVDQTTSGMYSIAANGRGVVPNVTITTAGISASMFAIVVMLFPLFACRKPLRKTSWPAVAMLCLAALIAMTLEACVFPSQLVFYVISPTKAVMIHESRIDHTPVVTIIEK